LGQRGELAGNAVGSRLYHPARTPGCGTAASSAVIASFGLVLLLLLPEQPLRDAPAG
jgi:hypothetical protein